MTQNKLIINKIINYGQGRKLEELEELINNIDGNKIIELLTNKIDGKDGITLWNYVLMGFSSSMESKDKRIMVVLSILNYLNTIELTTKQNFDMITRLFIDLPKFEPSQLVDIAELCVESLRIGDQKCIGWKDLLPEVLLLINEIPILLANGVQMSGNEYRENIVKTLSTIKWPPSILSAVACMFKEIPLTKEERVIIIGKISENLHNIKAIDLPSISYQLFKLCNSASLIIIPILSLEKYFYKNYYKKLYKNMDSDTTDFDSIDINCEKELNEIEETILYHLSNATENKLLEKDIVNTFKMLTNTPDYILTPFVISALITMSNINRYPETSNLLSSHILLYLRNIIANNEEEKIMCKESSWCRDLIESTLIDINKIFGILIDRSKDGVDIVTPGILNLIFLLLKSKNSTQNTIAINFLKNFLKKRFIFGQGIVKKLSEYLFVEQDALQYCDCLTSLSLTNALTISECIGSIEHILEYLLLIDGHHAMRMISFIIPLVNISYKVRDLYIGVLRKAMYSSELNTRKMGVFGFCLLLKYLKNNNSRRIHINGNNSSQTSISGLSLISQSTIDNINNPQRHFDLLALEIIGILRKCFNETVEIKEILYSGLLRAIEFNPKLIPYVLQFLDWHLNTYFVVDQLTIEIKFDSIVNNNNDVWDNLGKLINLIGQCIVIGERNNIEYDYCSIKTFMEALLTRIDGISLEHLGIIGTFDTKLNVIGTQYLNCMESLMSYAIWTSSPDTCINYILPIIKLFKHYNICYEEIKKLKIINKKQKLSNDTAKINQLIKGNINNFKPESVITLSTIERFLVILYDDAQIIINDDRSNLLRANRKFNHFLLKITIEHIINLRNQPNYMHMKFSKYYYNLIKNILKIIYYKCIKKFMTFYNNFDKTIADLCMELFKELLITINLLYKYKFNELLNDINCKENNNSEEVVWDIVTCLHNLLDEFIKENIDTTDIDIKDVKYPYLLLQCLEILYYYLPEKSCYSIEVFNWLYNFCINNTIDNYNLNMINNLLFKQRLCCNKGIFFLSIAIQIEKQLGKINVTKNLLKVSDEKQHFHLKTINLNNVTQVIQNLLLIIRKQLNDIDFVINKVKCLYNKYKIIGQGDLENLIQMIKAYERSINSELIHIGKILSYITNSRLVLGSGMDNVNKILIQFYVCLTNLTKYLYVRNSNLPISCQSNKFDQLIKISGKPLASNIYDLITYIEENIFDDTNAITESNIKTKKKNKPLTDKSKVLKETKLIPKLINRIENFNKFVIMLSKKIKIDLSVYLHIGTVRDFRIKTSELRDAINRTITESQAVVIDEDQMNTFDNSNDENDDVSEILTPQSSKSSNAIEIVTENSEPAQTIIIDNIKKINEKARKRKVSKDSNDNKVAKKKRSRKPMKIIRTSTASEKSTDTSGYFKVGVFSSKTQTEILRISYFLKQALSFKAPTKIMSSGN